MFIFKKALLFWRLATENEPTNEELYKNYIANLPTHYTSTKVNNFTRLLVDMGTTWQEEPYFKVSDFIGFLEQNFPFDDWDFFIFNRVLTRNSLADKYKQEIKLDIAKYYIKNKNTFTRDDYKEIEDGVYDQSSIVNEAQQRLIKEIATWGNDIDDDKIKNHETSISYLYQNTNFPKDILKEFAKNFGLDFYGRLASKDWSTYTEKMSYILKKAKFSVYDVATIFYGSDHFYKDTLNDIIERSDDEAKQFIRGYLYSGMQKRLVNNDNNPDNFFMFDEYMQPMNNKYQTIELPYRIWVYHLSKFNGMVVGDKWRKIFDEFQVVPQ